MRARITHIFCAIIVLSALSLLTFYRPLVSNRLFLYGDNVPQSLDAQNYTNMAIYVFNSKFIVGNPTFIAVNFVPFLFNKLATSGYLVSYASILWMLIPYFVFFICVFLFFYLLESKKMPALGASLFFMFSIVNVHLLVGGATGIYTSLIGCFLFLVSYIKFIQKPKTFYLVGMVFSSVIGFTNIAYFYTCLVVALIFTLILAVQDSKFVKNNFVKYVLGCLFFLIFAVLINAHWLLPFKSTLTVLAGSPYGTLSDPISQAYYWTAPAKNLLYSYNFQWAQEFSKIYSLYNSSIYTFVSLFYLFITFRYFYILETKDSVSRRVLATFICIFILSLGTYLPFWPFFLKSIPGWFLLRSAPLRFYPFALLFFSWLVVRLLIADKRYYKIFFLIYIIFTGFVFFRADIFNTLRGIELPRDYTNVIRYLNSNEPSHSPVLVYPKMSYSNLYTWNGGKLIYFPLDMLSSNPIIKFAGTSESVPIPYRGMYEGDKIFSEIASTASNLGIRFILLSNDIADKDLSFYASSNEFADRVYSGEHLSLYKIKDSMYMPAIISTYASEFWKINPTLYVFKAVTSPDGTADIRLNLPFDRNWQLNLGDFEQIICDPVLVAPLYASTVCKNSTLVKNLAFDYKSGMPPMRTNEGFNAWTLGETLPVPNATSKTNADKVVWGVIEYGPQKNFTGGLYISGVAICIMALFIAMIRLITYVKLHILQL